MDENKVLTVWRLTVWLNDFKPWQRDPTAIAMLANGLEYPDGLELTSVDVKPMQPEKAAEKPPSDIWALVAYMTRLFITLFGVIGTTALFLPRYGWPVFLVAIPINVLTVYLDKVVQRRDEWQGRIEAL